MKALHETIVEHLDHLIAGKGVRKAYVANQRGHNSRDPRAFALDHPRLILTLRGVRYHRYVVSGKVVETPVRKGEALLIAPHCPASLYYIETAAVLHINLCDSFTLFKLADFDGKRDTDHAGPVFEFRARSVLTVNSALNPDGQQLCELLCSVSPACHADRYRRNLVDCLALNVRSLLDRAPRERSGKAHNTWQAVCRYVQEHCSEPIDRKQVADAFRLHPNHISRLFQQHGRQGFTDYLNTQRIGRARELLLEHPELNVEEVANMAGFSATRHFGKTFRRYTGASPTRFRLRVSGD